MALTTVQAGLIGNSQVGVNVALNVGVPIIENTQAISQSYSISTGSSAISAGPITIATGATVTIPTGSKWVLL
jgi:energy-converting hydrogenase Eha subunit A